MILVDTTHTGGGEAWYANYPCHTMPSTAHYHILKMVNFHDTCLVPLLFLLLGRFRLQHAVGYSHSRVSCCVAHATLVLPAGYCILFCPFSF